MVWRRWWLFSPRRLAVIAALVTLGVIFFTSNEAEDDAYHRPLPLHKQVRLPATSLACSACLRACVHGFAHRFAHRFHLPTNMWPLGSFILLPLLGCLACRWLFAVPHIAVDNEQGLPAPRFDAPFAQKHDELRRSVLEKQLTPEQEEESKLGPYQQRKNLCS